MFSYEEIHVSTSTILRFYNKNNFDGYAEFKDALKNEITLQNAAYERLIGIFRFFLQGQIQVLLKKNDCMRLMYVKKLIEAVSQFQKKIWSSLLLAM